MKSLLFALLIVSVSLASRTHDPNSIAKVVSQAMDWTADPCENFYQYACGGWLANTVLPPSLNRLDRSFSTIETNNEEVLKHIVKNATDAKLSAFFQSCMDLDGIEKLGWTPILPTLALVENVVDLNSLMTVVGQLKLRGVDSFFSLGNMMDAEDPSIDIASFDQGGLSLPYPELYTANDEGSKAKRAAYMKHISNMFNLLGDNNHDADAMLAYQVEAAIAAFTSNGDDLTDPFVTYNKMSVDAFEALSPNLPWTSFFQTLAEFSIKVDNVTVTVPAFYSNLSDALPQWKANWKPYLTWQIVRQRANLLSKAFRDEYFNFWNRILKGQTQPGERWNTCVEYTDSNLGDLLGKYFVEDAFSGTSQTKAEDILAGILGAMDTNLLTITWMDNITRDRALEKLTKVTHLIGSPSNPDSYSDLNVGPAFHDNVVAASMRSILKTLQQIGRPSDKFEWEMTPATVNAYYDPSKNQMVFPAGILQDPFFNVEFPDAMNYGGIGMVQGHELTHGFDNQGRDYDGDGVLENWWEPQTSKEFDSKVQCMINQYSHFEVIPGVFINGRLTQGENIADNGGIGNAFRAFSKVSGDGLTQPSIVSNLTNAQLFFVAFGQTWCEKATDDYYKVQVNTDPHSPAKFRILGPLMNTPAFAETFTCPASSFMNPQEPCGPNPPAKSCHCKVW